MSEVTLTLTGTMPTEATSSPEVEALPSVLLGYPAPASTTLHRRSSLEEDYFYRQVMTVSKKPNEPPPSYESTIKRIRRMEREEKAGAASRQAAALLSATTAAATGAVSSGLRKGKGKLLLDSHGRSSGIGVAVDAATAGAGAMAEELPAYSCDINIEGVFQRKMEIENTTKRAADRRWVPMVVVLRGTALEVYNCRKDRSWVSRMTRGGPGVSPDNPPWLRRGSLEKSYNLAYADTGIASDYLKRRYVIRVRAETDQFLLSCVELETFVRWLDALFAALSIAAPIDERDFPRDQSIPRLQRIRWYHGRDREAGAQRDGDREMQAAMDGELQRTDSLVSSVGGGGAISMMRSGSSALTAASRLTDGTISEPSAVRPAVRSADAADSADSAAAGGAADVDADAITATVAPMVPLATRLSATNYPHDAVDTQTGKWQPRHRWTSTHDMVYAKLCYATLLFRSPRKSNYIIMRGKQWFVDWTTGNMFRVSPPRYGEVELFGPWQVVRTENVRI